MNPRFFKIANFFAFNLLFFALYLNFVHKDKNVQQAIITNTQTQVASGSLTVESTEQYVQKERAAKNATTEKVATKASKPSIN